jgi:hypothetical protein
VNSRSAKLPIANHTDSYDDWTRDRLHKAMQ